MRVVEGNRLIVHLAQAERSVLLCAPFIKVRVLKRLLDAVSPAVPVRVVTRWHPAEIQAGVSDLEVFDILAARDKAELALLDTLHAKAYAADETALVGSANLSARALGWRKPANVEMLVHVSIHGEEFCRLMYDLEASRSATEEERERVYEAAAALDPLDEPEDNDIVQGDMPGPWLPTLAAPSRLFGAYRGDVGTLASGVRIAAEHDLRELELENGLDPAAFKRAVAEAFVRLPGPALLLKRMAGDGLLDHEAARLVSTLVTEAEMAHAVRWEVMREWIETFLGDEYEVTPETFVTRRRARAPTR